jgi:hypothetical protein
MNLGTAHGALTTRRGRTVLVGVLAGVASLALGIQPAYAGNATKYWDTGDWTTATVVTFDGPRKEISNGLHADANLEIHSDGNWKITGSAKNNRIAWRNVTFHCTLTWANPTVATWSATIPRGRVDGKSSKTRTRTGNDPILYANFRTISEIGSTDCWAVKG